MEISGDDNCGQPAVEMVIIVGTEHTANVNEGSDCGALFFIVRGSIQPGTFTKGETRMCLMYAYGLDYTPGEPSQRRRNSTMLPAWYCEQEYGHSFHDKGGLGQELLACLFSMCNGGFHYSIVPLRAIALCIHLVYPSLMSAPMLIELDSRLINQGNPKLYR